MKSINFNHTLCHLYEEPARLHFPIQNGLMIKTQYFYTRPGKKNKSLAIWPNMKYGICNTVLNETML